MSNINNSKLLRNLRLLTARERGRFLDYVNSPFFNTHPCTRALAHLLLTQENDWEELTKQKLFASLYPHAVFREEKVNNVMSYLMKLLEGFLTQLGLEASHEADILMLQAAHQRQMTKLVSLGLKKARKVKSRPHHFGSHQLMRVYLLDLLQHDIHRQEERHISDKSIVQVLHALDNWYQVLKLEKSCELMAIVGAGEYRSTLPPDLVSMIERESESEPPLITIYRNCLLTIIEPEKQDHYFELKRLMEENQHHLPKEDHTGISRHLLNYCAKKINQHDLSFRQEMFSLYKQAISNGMVFQNGLIYQITYNNIVSLACFLGDFEWASDFIEKYQKNLLKEARKNAYNFNLAKVRLYQGRHQDALDMLGRVQFTNFFYQMRSRLYQIIAYYELGEFQMAGSNIENLRLYMLRSREAARFRKSGNRFIRFSKSLITLQQEKKRLGNKVYLRKLKELSKKIEAADEAIIEQEWLEKKLTEATLPQN